MKLLIPGLHSEGLQPLGQLLVRLYDELHQVLCEVAVLVVEEGGGQAEVAHPAGTADPVNVLLNVRRHVEVDHVLHVGDVQPTGGHL